MIRYLTLILIFSGIIICQAASVASTRQAQRDSITILYAARKNVINSRLNQQLDSTRWEEDEFRIFLSYLDGRIVYYCKQLYRSHGPDGVAGLPCPAVADNSAGLQLDILPQIDAATPHEQTAEVETEFQASLGQFDEMLLKEQEQIQGHAPKQREYPASQSSSGSRGHSYPDDQTIRQEPGKTGREGADNRSGNSEISKSETRGGGAGSTKQSRTLPSVGNKEFSENDDDIVARQLREAAEQETDPEIKARLWEEYYQYKQGTR